MLSLDNPSNCS